MEVSIKNHADAMIFYTAICVEASQIALIAEQNLIFCSQFLRDKRFGMEDSMNFLYIVIKNIVVCMFINNIVELVVSSEEYKKYIRLFIGVLLVMIMIPKDLSISSIMNNKSVNVLGKELNNKLYGVNKQDTDNVIEKRIDDMRENEISKIKQVRERIYSNMERDLKLLLKEDKNVASVKVEVFENNYKLRGKNRKDADYKNGIYGMDYKLINNAYIKVYVKDKSGVAKDELIKSIYTMICHKYSVREDEIKIEII